MKIETKYDIGDWVKYISKAYSDQPDNHKIDKIVDIQYEHGSTFYTFKNSHIQYQEDLIISKVEIKEIK